MSQPGLDARVQPSTNELWIKLQNGSTVSSTYPRFRNNPENEYDLDRIKSLQKQGLLQPVHVLHICTSPKLKNTHEAFQLVRHLRYRIGIYAAWLQKYQVDSLDIENYCTRFHNKLIEYSGFAALRVKLALRAAFRKLEFRCLRKAFAPGNRGCKRLRDAFKDDFQEL